MNGKKVDVPLYRFVMRQPVGPRYSEYRRDLSRYVSSLSKEAKADLRERRYEILEAWAEWVGDNYEILLRLGFHTGEAEMLKVNRINSPGMRNAIKVRVGELTKVRSQK